MKKCLSLGLIALVLFPTTALADMITTSASFSDFGPVTLNQFNTEGGTLTLTSVETVFVVDPLSIFISGTSTDSGSVLVTTSGSVYLTGGPPSADISIPTSSTNSYNLEPGDFQETISISTSSSQMSTPSDFLGTGQYSLTVGASGNVNFTGGSVIIPLSFPADINGSVSVTYTYSDNGSGSTVPEPSSFALLVSGIVVLAGSWYCRRHRARLALEHGA